MRAFNGMRRLSSRQTSDEALEPKPVNRKSNPSSPLQLVETNSDATRCLPPSRISETRETTDGSAELKFRIHVPPAESRTNFDLARGTDSSNPFHSGKSQANFPTALARPNRSHLRATPPVRRSC